MPRPLGFALRAVNKIISLITGFGGGSALDAVPVAADAANGKPAHKAA